MLWKTSFFNKCPFNKISFLFSILCLWRVSACLIWNDLYKKGIKSLQQILIFSSLYICNQMAKSLDLSKLEYQRYTPAGCKDIRIRKLNFVGNDLFTFSMKCQFIKYPISQYQKKCWRIMEVSRRTICCIN